MRFTARPSLPHLIQLLTIMLTFGGWANAAHLFPHIDIQKAGEQYQITVGELPLHYFHFQHSTDLQQFSTIGAGLGTPGPTFGYSPDSGETRGFFRAEAVSAWSPSDVDLDGMDDLWELLNGLDPRDPADADQPSTLHPGMTNLEAYRFSFGLTRVTEFYSVETSVFNSTFAISEEVSVFNTPQDPAPGIAAISDEVSVFNGFSMQPAAHVLSIEIFVLNSNP